MVIALPTPHLNAARVARSKFKERGMPIYEYRCRECHQVFEEWSKQVNDGSLSRNCPICKGQANRLISNTTFALKGGGWYVTEYGTHKKQAADGGAEPSAGNAATAPVTPVEGGGKQSSPSAEARS